MPEDVALMKALGLTSYRFSIAWSRILPEGRGRVNPKGLSFYDRLVDALLGAGIAPTACLYHWDLPQAIYEQGGWGNRQSVDWFAEYADEMYKKLGDRVRRWGTHNEPWVSAFLGNSLGVMAPGLADTSLAYQAAHHLLLAHAKAVQVYRAGGYQGEIGIILDIEHTFPASDADRDVAAWRRYTDHYAGLFADPLFKGHYSQELMEWLGPMAPRVQPGDMELIQEPVDYLGINYYRGVEVRWDPGNYLKAQITHMSQPLWGRTKTGWGVYPDGLTEVLLRFKNQYGNPKMLVTENGVATPDRLAGDEASGERVEDVARINYLRAHILACHAAIQQGANLQGYFVWSLLDNFEWAEGYAPRFGLVWVDFPTGRRIQKRSFDWYCGVIRRNGVEE